MSLLIAIARFGSKTIEFSPVSSFISPLHIDDSPESTGVQHVPGHHRLSTVGNPFSDEGNRNEKNIVYRPHDCFSPQNIGWGCHRSIDVRLRGTLVEIGVQGHLAGRRNVFPAQTFLSGTKYAWSLTNIDRLNRSLAVTYLDEFYQCIIIIKNKYSENSH